MSRTSEARVIVREKDKVLICNEKHGRGRCRKLLMTTDGKLLCKNGHTVTIGEVWNAYLSRPDWDLKAIGHIWPNANTMAAILKRIATPEFLEAEFLEWQERMVNYFPFLSWLLHNAVSSDRRIAVTLKRFWEKEIREKFPLLGRYLEAVEHTYPPQVGGSIQVRERIFRSLSGWKGFCHQPGDYLALWEVYVEAAGYLGDEHVVLYRHNVNESLLCIESGGKYAPLYFMNVNKNSDLIFSFLPDPLWKLPSWYGDQITLLYLRDSSDIKCQVSWFEEGDARNSRIACNVRKRLNTRAMDIEVHGLKFYADDNDSIHIINLSEMRSNPAIEIKPSEVLWVMEELRAQLICEGLNSLLESNVV